MQTQVVYLLGPNMVTPEIPVQDCMICNHMQSWTRLPV